MYSFPLTSRLGRSEIQLNLTRIQYATIMLYSYDETAIYMLCEPMSRFLFHIINTCFAAEYL